MKWPSKMLQNMPYSWNTKTYVVFFCILFAFLINALIYGHRPGHSLWEKNKVARNEKRKKNLYSKKWQILKHFARSFHQA